MAQIHNFTVDQGATWQFDVIFKDDEGVAIDITGYSCKMHIRRNKTSGLEQELTSDNNTIAITPAAGKLTFTLSNTVTSSLSGQYVYDIELTSDAGFVTRLLQGKIIIDTEVTK